ncbi:hypothetical protein JL721_11430 [Aureococcus anophagefferens]|nr:hypothetical protein JL721_11430 [Aureococcus anophagefferens]
MGAASGIMVAKEDAVFPDSGAYGGWPTSSVELCLEKYLSLREHKDVDMDGTIRNFHQDRIATEGKMDRQSVRRASSALQDGEMLMANKKLGVAIATADATHNNSAKYDLEKVRKKHDGRVRAVASSTTMARLVSEVDFGYEDLHNLRLEFADASDRSGKDGPYLTCDRLKDMLLARFRRSKTGANNKIYFPEFARALSKLVGSFEEQMSFIFALCDKDADGQLELWELSDLISDASDDMNELGDHIKARIPTFDDGGGFVEMVEFEALLKSDAHLYLNFYWAWVAIAVGVLPNFELALRMCPAFSAAAGLATAGDWKIGALELAQVLFGALGVPVPAGESFRALQPSEGDGVPAKDDGETPRAAAKTAPLMFKLSKAVTLIFDELLGAYKRRAAHAAANPKPGEVDQFGAPLLPIESEGMDEIPAARVWATVAHYTAARRRGPHQVDANLTRSRPRSFPRVVAFEAIEDDYHPDPIVSPSSRSLKNPPQLPKIPMAKIFTFTNEVCAIHDAWELTLAEAFEAMDANQDGSVSFDELLKYSRMNRELPAHDRHGQPQDEGPHRVRRAPSTTRSPTRTPARAQARH